MRVRECIIAYVTENVRKRAQARNAVGDVERDSLGRSVTLVACHSLPHEAPACSWRLAGRWCHPLRGFTHAIELLDTIPGVDQHGAEVIVAEIGIDMARFETAPRLAAWAGVAPGNDESAGKQRSGKTRKGNRSLRAVLTQLAHAAVRTKGTNFSALYRHLAARRGKQRAIMAVAHSIMRSVFHMLSRNEPYRELGDYLTSGGGTIQWIGSPDGLNISGTMSSFELATTRVA